MTIRNLDDPLKARLRMRAARHGRSMEEEARDILRVALAGDSDFTGSLAERIRTRLAGTGGFDVPAAPRDPIREAPDFGA